MDIITRDDAKTRGLKFYFTGAPCTHGHLSTRYLCGQCRQCHLDRMARYRNNNREKYNAHQRANMARLRARRRAEEHHV